MNRLHPALLASGYLLWTTFASPSAANLQASEGNWPRFRGADGAGQLQGAQPPLEWSKTQNVSWKVNLPGMGSSSPVVWGDKVWVTAYSGYGQDPNRPGNIQQLKRHLICVSAKDGRVLWQRTVEGTQPEDAYDGFLREHGYASSSPVTDGKAIYVFFGKAGVHAFSMDGEPLWSEKVGSESGNRRWGSAASPILYKDKLIVNATEESQSIRALDTQTGREIWKAEAASLELVYSTPLVVRAGDHDELVVGAPNEVWGLNPDTGKLLWYADSPLPGNISPSVVSDGKLAYVFGGYPRQGAIAVRPGGNKDVTRSHVAWQSNRGPYIPTPVLHDGHFYWVNRQGIAWCVRASDGELVYQERLDSPMPARVYASPILVEDKIVVVTRNAGTFILAASPQFKQIARNDLGDDSDFSASPAVAGNRLWIRSASTLYCIAE